MPLRSTRSHRRGARPRLAAILAGCAACAAPPQPAPTRVPLAPPPAIPAELAGLAPAVLPADVWRVVRALAADSTRGRGTGTVENRRVAQWLAAELQRAGVRPGGDGGTFLQRVPLRLVVGAEGRSRAALAGGIGALDTVPVVRRAEDFNVVGVLPGSDARLRGEAVVLGAHFDHVGVGPAAAGDSIYNGADDNASGVAAVLEAARHLARERAPRRTVIFLLTTGEEAGLLGTRWFLERPPVPLARIVADLQVEMIGRPDSLAGGPGRAWLAGYERSTVGDLLASAGLAIGPDRRPQMNFWERSDNIAFARAGIPAHTVSSYALHRDYHRPTDTAERLDFAHMTRVIGEIVRATRLLASVPAAPQWRPGGRPAGAVR